MAQGFPLYGSVHDQVVQQVASQLNAVDPGYVTFTNEPLQTYPMKHDEKTYWPDTVTVRISDWQVTGLIEVETAETVGVESAKQWRNYKAIADRNSCDFCLLVPEGYRALALLNVGYSTQIFEYGFTPDGSFYIL